MSSHPTQPKSFRQPDPPPTPRSPLTRHDVAVQTHQPAVDNGRYTDKERLLHVDASTFQFRSTFHRPGEPRLDPCGPKVRTAGLQGGPSLAAGPGPYFWTKLVRTGKQYYQLFQRSNPMLVIARRPTRSSTDMSKGTVVEAHSAATHWLQYSNWVDPIVRWLTTCCRQRKDEGEDKYCPFFSLEVRSLQG